MKKDKKVDKKIKHLIKHFGFKKNELLEIEKMYSGEFFNKNDNAYLKLLKDSDDLCNEYSTLLQEEMRQKSKTKKCKLPLFKYLHFYFKKSKILKLLFPIHGFILYSETGIQAVIGLVDLKGYGFINKNVVFTANSLVEIKKSNIFAFNIVIGDESLETNNNLCRLSKIVIDKNCWIGAGSNIFGNVHIGNNSVIGCGSNVINDIPSYSLAVGRPAKVIRRITNKDKLVLTKDISPILDNKQIEIVSNLSGGKIPKHFIKMIAGNPFNTLDKQLSNLYNITRKLCFEYNDNSTTFKRKQEILDMLFIGHGQNLVVGKEIFVDMLGTIKIGDNVRIGDNVFIGGNVQIESDVTIENNAILFSSGHSLISKERIMSWSLKQGFYEYTQYNKLMIKNGINIGQNVIITPKSIVDCDIPANTLYAKNKIIKY